MSRLAQYMEPEDILLDVEVDNKDQLFDKIGTHMNHEHALSRDMLVAGLARREKVGSTALGEGVAIPHTRVEGISSIHIAYLRLKKPIPYDAPDERPVTDILVLLVPMHAVDEHLLMLAEASRIFADDKFRHRLHTCHRATEIRSVFALHCW